MLEVNEGIGRPELLLQFLAGDYLPRPLQQEFQDSQRLALNADFGPLPSQLSRGDIQFENAEPDDALSRGSSLSQCASLS